MYTKHEIQYSMTNTKYFFFHDEKTLNILIHRYSISKFSTTT